MISARLRHGSAWSDARILNISSRGLLMQAPAAPRRGTYVEICKGQHRIVARVVWTGDDRFGVRSQDRLAVDSITMGIEPPATAERTTDRRAAPRRPTSAERHERSRRRSRAIEFVCVVAFGAAAAALAYDAVKAALLRPLTMVSAQLGDKT